MKKSFTLIEILVTSTIIMIMLGVTISYTRRSENINKINRASERLAFDIRRVANLSMQTRQIDDKKICGWGIYFDPDKKDSYIIFSDFCDRHLKGDSKYQEEEKVEEVRLPINTFVNNVNFSILIYLPPEPRIYLYDVGENLVVNGKISIGAISGNYQRIIEINQVGNINVRSKHDN